jgi:hypothetical protein
MGKPALVLVQEGLERGRENRIIDLYTNTKSQVEDLQKMYQKHMDDIKKSQITVEERKEEIEERRKLISLWHGVVEEVIDHNDDWTELEDAMRAAGAEDPEDREGSAFLLTLAVEDFELLKKVAVEYIDYDNKVASLPLPEVP